MMSKNKMSRCLSVLIACAFTLIGADKATACNVGPFHAEIKQKMLTRSITRGASNDSGVDINSLALAETVTADATVIQSDNPFLLANIGRLSAEWKMNTATDTVLSINNTVVEFYGYFNDFLGEDFPPAVRNQVLRKIRENFDDIAPRDLMHYPRTDASERVDAAIEQTFGNRAGEIKSEMLKRNGDTSRFGFPYVSRASFMSSQSLAEQFGQGTTIMCMTLAYSRDRFTNTDPELRNHLIDLPFQSFRSSVVDYMAAKATEARALGEDVTKKEYKMFGGGLTCQLTKPTGFYLALPPTTRCGGAPKLPTGIEQKHPVVRGIGDNRFVQIGKNLYSVQCTGGAAENYDLSVPSINPPRTFKNVVQQAQNEVKSSGGLDGDRIRTALNLISQNEDVQASEREFVISTASKCDLAFQSASPVPSPASVGSDSSGKGTDR